MKTVKRILIILVIIIAIPLIAALFVKREFSSERQITINKPRQEVFDYIKYLGNQKNYDTWHKMDPTVKSTTSGTDGTVGFVYAWDGEKIGKGEQEITNIVAGERMDTELRFKAPFESEASCYMLTEATGENQTVVKWGISGKSPYPFNLMSLFFDMGDDFDEGLKNLKSILETQ
jgi:hypothetical protein